MKRVLETHENVPLNFFFPLELEDDTFGVSRALETRLETSVCFAIRETALRNGRE